MLEGAAFQKDGFTDSDTVAVSGSNKEADCAAEGYWYETKGYRKIPGDLCYGGVDLEPIKHSCGGMT